MVPGGPAIGLCKLLGLGLSIGGAWSWRLEWFVDCGIVKGLKAGVACLSQVRQWARGREEPVKRCIVFFTGNRCDCGIAYQGLGNVPAEQMVSR